MAGYNGVNEPRKAHRRTFSAEGKIRVVLDDFSRRIPEWQLQPSMDAEALAEVVELTCDETRVGRVPPNNRPHVLSDRGTALFSRSFGQYLEPRAWAASSPCPLTADQRQDRMLPPLGRGTDRPPRERVAGTSRTRNRELCCL
jgi:hypothetical protein